MFGKLLKYDFKRTARSVLPALIIIPVCACLIGVLLHLEIYVIDGFRDLIGNILHTASIVTIVIAGLVLCGSITAVTVLIFLNFYKSIATDEGYLTHTLPVTTTEMLLSKTLTAIIWFIITVIVGAVSFFGMIAIVDLLSVKDVVEMIGDIKDEFGIENVFYFFEIILMGFAMLTSYVCLIETAIITGSVISTKHKLLTSIGMVVAFSFINNLINNVLMIINTYTIPFDEPYSAPLVKQMQFSIIFTILFSIALTFGYFMLGKTLLKKKINLE